MLELVKEPFSRLKWGFLPVRRIVDEDVTEDFAATDKEPSGLQKADYEEQTESISDEQQLEYRDEANRPWWKFFDEYEYRLNKQTRKSHKWYKWFDDNDTPAERKLMWKIDILLTFYAMLAYWVKMLDQTNLNNAYTSGLKEDIGMKGNDLVDTQVLFTTGNIIFQIPFMYFLNAVPLSYVLPGFELGWSILTVLTYKVDTVPQLKAIRFFIGAFEAPGYLSFQYLFGTFIFNPSMIARRSMIFYFGQFLGVMTSGLLSGAIVDRFDGVSGLAAWRWIFIIDGCLSVVVALLGFYMLPGTPTDCYSIFLTDDEIRLLRRRLKQNHTAGRPQVDLVKSFFDLNVWKRIFFSWEIYILTFWNMLCWNNNNGSSGAYLLWLKSLGIYTHGQVQFKSALTPGLGILWLFFVCMYADLFQSRWSAIVLSQVFNFLGNVILAAWDVPRGAKWFAWCLQYFGWSMAPVLYSWMNDICRRDAQRRAVTLVIMNMIAQASTAWMAVIVWKTKEAPRYLKGYSFTATCAFALSVWTLVVLFFYKRQERSFALQNGIVLYNSKTSPETVPPGVDSETPSSVIEESVSDESEKNDSSVEKH